ncbi:uncharacterized protein LODBEIA_P22730 [Lodderomyces beijingensis]|uniref:Actin-like protein ARP9 n=1 Tax=Lodderomyces beijingensis TaxID=1775926 RepID=A0ABP0ZIT8_9ASCO
MPLYKEDNYLVISPGSKVSLFSCGLRDSLSPPQFRIPSVVYQSHSTQAYLSTPSNDDGDDGNGNGNDDLKPIYPIQDSKIVDLDAFNALLRIILSSIIKSNPILTINHIPMLIIVPSLTWSKRQVEYITKFVFEKLEITAFNILDLSLASVFSIGGGTVNSTVVYVEDSSIQVVPVIGYQSIKFAGSYIKGAGAHIINEEIKEKVNDLSDSQIEDLKYSGIFEFLPDGKQDAQADAAADNADGEFDVAKIVAESNGADESEQTKIKNNRKYDKNFFIDSQTKEKITIGKERFFTSSRLIDVIAKGIYDTLLNIDDLDKRQDCYDNIILVGPVFQIRGLKNQVIAKLESEYLVREPPSDKNGNTESKVNSAIARYQQTDDVDDGAHLSTLSQVPNSIGLAKLPEYFPEWKIPKAFGGSWQDLYFLGGEIYAKQIFSGGSHHNKELFVGSDMYEERGPQSIWDVSI